MRRPDAIREGGTKVSDHSESRFLVAWMGDGRGTVEATALDARAQERAAEKGEEEG